MVVILRVFRDAFVVRDVVAVATAVILGDIRRQANAIMAEQSYPPFAGCDYGYMLGGAPLLIGFLGYALLQRCHPEDSTHHVLLPLSPVQEHYDLLAESAIRRMEEALWVGVTERSDEADCLLFLTLGKGSRDMGSSRHKEPRPISVRQNALFRKQDDAPLIALRRRFTFQQLYVARL